MLAVVCMIRSGSGYFWEFRTRIDTLADRVPLRVIIGENDSLDNTKDLCEQWAMNDRYEVTVIDRSEGGEHYPSIDFEPRWRHIAHVMNGVLDEVREDDDFVMYVDPDLVWDPDMIVRLLAHLQADEVDVVAPLAWARQDRPFDLWGTRRHGQGIQAQQPWLGVVQNRGLIDVDSAACLNVMDAHWARVARFGETNANVGWHDQMREKGARIWLDLDSRVYHP